MELFQMGIKKSIVGFSALVLFALSAPASAAITSVTPNTWNIIGLDSNTPAFGPYRFPVGAKVCSDAAGVVPVTFTWDSANSYVYLRAGSNNPVNLTFSAAGCLDAYFEVEVDKVAAAFDTTRLYHITAGGVSTPTPRELFVEHLVSQSRNGIDYVKLNSVSIPAGGSMNLMVGNTYTIELGGHTAPGGYNQFEEFINFPNTIFQIQSINTTYSSEDSPYVNGAGHPQLYADACRWENDPNSPYYRSCWEDWKAGDTVITTYTVKIIAGGGSTEALNTLLYDFSGSSFHYNADFSTGVRFANIIDPTTLTISKSFSPDPVNVGGVSALTFTISNPNPGTISGVNFTDVFPNIVGGAPGDMVVDAVPNASANGCGTPTFAPVAGAGSISFSDGTIAANSSCTVKVNVTAPATGTYTNTSGNLFVGTLDTGKTATDTLTVDNSSFPLPSPPSTCPGQEVILATWNMANGVDGSGFPAVNTPLATGVATATASYSGTGAQSIDTATGNPANSWKAVDGWSNSATGFPNSAAPYFQLDIDTSNYGGAMLSFDYALFDNQGWGGTNAVYIYSSANGGAYGTVYNAGATKNSWQINIASGTAATTGTNTTSFRINATASNGTKTSDGLYLDNVVIKGCKRPNPPTITKSFSPNPVAVGGTSTLTFTVVNPNAGSSLSGVAFTDTLPSGLTVADSTTSQCGGVNNVVTTAATGTIVLAGGTLAAAGSCAVTATVTATTAGPHDNVSGFVEAAESGKNTGATGVATASLTAVLPPEISKLFAQNPILAGGVSTLTFTITNPNQNNALSGVAFSDTFPATMVVATPATYSTSGCGAPTYAPVAGAGSISFTNGTIAAAGTCYVTVNVTAPATGTYANTSGNVSHLINAATVNGNTASDTLTVSDPHPGVAILKQISKNVGGPWTTYIPVTTGANVYYRFTVENFGDVDLTSVSVTDPAFGGTVCSPGNLAKYATATCTVPPVAAVAGFNLNTATAHGFYGVTEYTDWSVAAYATTGLSIVKSATETNFTAAGNVLHYSYVVKNIGYAPLLGLATVADDKSSDESCPAISTATGGPADGDNYLDRDEQITCTATYTVIAADVTAQLVTNVASATIDGVTSPTDTETVPLAMPSLLVVKSVTAYSDPINGTTSPKAIPGSFMTYTILVTNTGPGAADNNTTVITDPIPANTTELFVGDINGAGSGPVLFTDGATASGLCYDYANPGACAGDNIEFSNTASPGPYVYGYAPTADGNGCDAAITSLKITLGGPFSGTIASGGSNTSFDVKFRVRVK